MTRIAISRFALSLHTLSPQDELGMGVFNLLESRIEVTEHVADEIADVGVDVHALAAVNVVDDGKDNAASKDTEEA
jgi:hypothetical protein